MFFSRSSVLALAAVASAASTVTVNQATYDGKCYYPVGDAAFPKNLKDFTGRWYQVAGTEVPFTAGCSCIYTDYTLNAQGTVDVLNGCQQIAGIKKEIRGTAKTVDAAYGAGALQVSFQTVPGKGIICPGPNYIVQKYGAGGQYAIVQSPLFSSLFLLSRKPNPAEAEVNSWLEEAYRLGTSRTAVKRVSQENCKYPGTATAMRD